ncbi:MAG: hypothetical protein H7Z42_21200, partial [Roseiflexaceae bacterium]|nr:hypothetical protein [Roseiflexaceae bacterium]
MLAGAQHFRRISAWLPLLIGLATLALGAWLVFRPAPRNLLREGDALLAGGHYYGALLLYRAAARDSTSAPELLRVGMVETVRGEDRAAGRSLAQALNGGLSPVEHDLARLYQGQAAAQAGQQQQAIGFWRTIERGRPLYAPQQVLEGEALLRAADYAAAESAYQAALDAGLPQEWRRVALARVAALRASSDREGALAALAAIAAPQGQQPEPLVTPLLPIPAPAPGAIQQALDSPADQRTLLLGQVYLDAGLIELAAAQFSAAGGRVAQAYAAYAQLRAGDRAGGQARLEQLVAEQPEDARARALLALAYLGETDTRRARAQLETIRALAPTSPDTHLAWGQWYAAQSDYVAAAGEYRRALAEAPADQRGAYLLALARFHIDTSLTVCDQGRPAAEDAAIMLDTAPAWNAAAEAGLSCGDALAASAAANRARTLDPT